MNDSVLKAFENLGFELKDRNEYAYAFDYENLHLLLMKNPSDEAFLSIALPGYCDTDDTTEEVMAKTADELNRELKYVKTYRMGDSLWLFYERELFGDETVDTFEQVIERMVLRLVGGLQMARKVIHKLEHPESSDASDEASDSDDENND